MITVAEVDLLRWLDALLLPLFRTLALMASAPILSHRSIPMRVRVGLAMVCALPLSGLLPTRAEPLLGSAGAFVAVATEIFVGVAIGFGARVMMAAFEIAGEAVGLQIGLSYAGFFDPQSGSANAVGRTFSTVGLLLFLVLQGPAILFAVLARSFERLPAGEPGWPALTRLPELGGELFSLALSIALPFLALLLFVNLALGFISRVAPQLNVFAIGFPITTGAGLALLAIGLPMFEPLVNEAISRWLSALGI